MNPIDAALSRDTPPATPSRSPRQRLLVAGALVLIAVLALLPRVPMLANAAYSFNSDEAINVLVIQHLLKGEFTLFNWDATYYGIVEGLVTVPFLLLGIAAPLAAKLASTVGFLLLLVGVFFLAKRLLGTAGGLVAAALLIVWSPSFMIWTLMAASSISLTVAWGTLSFLHYGRLKDRPSYSGLILLGVMLGFGYYMYELYLVYIGTFVAAWFIAGLPRLAPFPREGRLAQPGFAQPFATVGLLAVGFAIGAVPKIALVLSRLGLGSKRPSYGFASLEEMISNFKLLVRICGPSMVGANLGHGAESVQAGLPNVALGVFLVILYTGIVVAACFHPAIRRSLRLDQRQGASVGLLVVLLVPVNAALFVASKNATNLFSNHYLMPWMTSLPVLTAAVVVWIGGRRRAVTAGLAAVLIAIPTVEIVQLFQRSHQFHYLGPHLEIVRNPDPLDDVQRFLLDQGVGGVYCYYWIAYKADAEWGERPVASPMKDWLRYPPYQAAADAAAREAYVFTDPGQEAVYRFPADVIAAGRKYRRTVIPPYIIYTSADGQRLLPSPNRARELSDFSADLNARHPLHWPAGSTGSVRVMFRNLGAETWSRRGDSQRSGRYQVTVGYRWIDAHGNPVGAETVRSALPSDIRPGQAGEVATTVSAPKQPGHYSLVLSLVQEGVRWFSDAGQGNVVLPAEVVAAPATVTSGNP